MDLDVRAITADELADYVLAMEAAFGTHATDADIERVRAHPDAVDRSIAVFDGDQIVATAGVWTTALTLPGERVVPVAGVTAVGVLPTHRRRGLLTAMMERQLRDVRERGEPLAVLLASESVIYGRFGYGRATSSMTIDVDPRRATFGEPPSLPGRVSLVRADRAREIVPAVYEQGRTRQPGALERTPAWWTSWFADPEKERRGYGPLFFAVHETPAGDVDGVAAYRMRMEWPEGLPGNVLMVEELLATSAEVRGLLWRFCLEVDLVARVTARHVPLDEPLPWMLTDPRRVRVTRMGDFLWARLLDIPLVLGARRYASSGAVVFRVSDPFLPELSGDYRLEGGPDGAESRRDDGAEADIALGVADLGAVHLGGVRLSTLARSGRVTELTVGALARADAMFASDPLPYCNTEF